MLIRLSEVELELQYFKEGILLRKVVVSVGHRRQGLGTKQMKYLCDYADETNSKIILTPESSLGSSKTRLIKFYKDFGFVKRKGYYELPLGSMIRLPQK